MFRKIHSNRDPKHTVISELKREFRPYLKKGGSLCRSALMYYPRFVFWLMAFSILVSAILAATVFKPKDDSPAGRKPVKITAPVSNGIDQIMQTSEAISDMMRLKKSIDSLSGKKHLTPQDSIRLEQALDRFQQLTKKFNHSK